MSRVLIVDDEPELLEILRFALELQGHEVNVADTSQQALEILRAGKIEALITDQRLPGGKTGIELIRHARENLASPPRAVLITGFNEFHDGQLEGLTERVFHKPFNLDLITGWVNSL